MNHYEKYKVDIPIGESGEWRIEKFKVEEEDVKRQEMRASFHPGEWGRIVPVGEYTRLMHGDVLVMSDTPAEIMDHLDVIREAKGRVLLNGLGLGVVLDAILHKPEVQHITVIEISKDVRRLVGQHYLHQNALHLKTNKELQIIVADAMTWRPKSGERFDVVWHDIWNNICADNLPEMIKLHRAYGRRCNWQGSWGREMCEYHKRTGW